MSSISKSSSSSSSSCWWLPLVTILDFSPSASPEPSSTREASLVSSAYSTTSSSYENYKLGIITVLQIKLLEIFIIKETSKSIMKQFY